MSRLFLLRHAKAGWALPGMRDFDRPLDASGLEDAQTTGVAMRASGYVPDFTLCSTARRARETLEGVAGQADTGRVHYLDSLYSDDAAGYLATIRDQGGLGSLWVIGHNPMLEDVAMALAGDGDDAARLTLAHGFPTSGLAIFVFPGPLAGAGPGSGYLEGFLTPSDM